MNDFIKYFVFLQFSVQLLSVLSYTVVLKQVKTLQPSVKVYRYDLRPSRILPESNVQYFYNKPLLGQKIYPVPLKHGRDNNFKLRPPVQKEKSKSYKGGGEKPPFRDPRLLGFSPSQHLVPPVSNQLEDHTEAKEEEDNQTVPLITVPNLGKSFSSFGQEKGRIYSNPGKWATPAPEADAEKTTKAEFTPSQLYLQIRHKNTVIHVPQSEALKDAETLEELINAPRLKELARTTHVQETYSEEGYEDAGYDHAGHIRQAQHGEVYDSKDEGKFRIKDPPVIINEDSNLEESKRVPSKNFVENKKELVEENLINKLEPRITRSRSEVSKTSVEYAKVPKNYKGGQKYSSRVKGPLKGIEENGKYFNVTDTKGFSSAVPTFPSYFGEMPPTPQSFLMNDSALHYKPSSKKSSKYRKDEFNSTKIYPVPEDVPTQINDYTNFKPYISLIDSQASPSAKSLKYSRIYSKKTKQLRLEPYKNENIFSPPPPPFRDTESPPNGNIQLPSSDDKLPEEEPINQRIVLPTIGYINSLTTAYFGKNGTKPPPEESKTQITNALNLTQALDYLRLKKNQKNSESTKSPTEIDVRSFESMKLKKSRPSFHSFINKSKRDVYLVRTRDKRGEKETEDYEGNDESDAPHNDKNEEIAEDERKRIEAENQEKEKYEASLRQEISNQEQQILQETFKNIGVEEDISEVFPALPSSGYESDFSPQPVETTPTPVNVKKYPFYLSKRLPENSPLRYATNPKQFPKKSGYKMEFYESREEVIQCPDFHPDLGDLPNSNSTEYSEEQPGENQRIAGLGDKITCLRMKYFDPDPFDNPIFKEKEIDYVGKPRNKKKVRIQILPKSSEEENEELQQTAHQRSSGKILYQTPNFQTRNQNISNISQETRHHVIDLLRPKGNETETSRIIPVTETLNDVSPSPVTSFLNPLIGWKTTYHSKQSQQDHLTYPKVTKQFHPHPPKLLPKLFVLPNNCLHNISKLAILDGTKNLTIACRDGIVIQEVVRNVARLRIIPKENKKQIKKKWSDPVSFNESDWIPIGFPSSPKNFHKVHRSVSRRTDEITKLKNETDDNTSSDHYMIDGLKEEDNVRKGEVLDDINHYMKLMSDLADEEKTAEKTENTTEVIEKREKREAQNFPPKDRDDNAKTEEFKVSDISKLFEMKKPLTRLSGRDFLVRYYRNKGKHNTDKTEDFWKVTNTQKSQRKYTAVENPISLILKTTEGSVTSPLYSTTEANTKNTEVFESQQPNFSTEKKSKFKIKKTEHRKISPLNLIPEKITKRPDVRISEFRKTTENVLEIPKIVTKVSVKMSHSTVSSGAVPQHLNSTRTTGTGLHDTGTSSVKPEVPQYKTANRSSNFFANESKNLASKSTDNSEGPVLYYVVNLKTGRGKWITNYVESRKERIDKGYENQNSQESSGSKRNKRKKKHKN